MRPYGTINGRKRMAVTQVANWRAKWQDTNTVWLHKKWMACQWFNQAKKSARCRKVDGKYTVVFEGKQAKLHPTTQICVVEMFSDLQSSSGRLLDTTVGTVSGIWRLKILNEARFKRTSICGSSSTDQWWYFGTGVISMMDGLWNSHATDTNYIYPNTLAVLKASEWTWKCSWTSS